MKRFMFLASAIVLLTLVSDSLALAGFVSFSGIVRSTIILPAGQTFPWSSGGLSGTVIARPSGSVTALTSNTPSAGNGRGTRSSFYTGMHSDGGTVGVYYEFIFDKPIDITVYNAETLAGPERITLNTNGSPWTGGWYSVTTGNLVGIGTRSVAMSTSGPTPPNPFAAVSTKGVTRLEFRNEIILAPGVEATDVRNGLLRIPQIQNNQRRHPSRLIGLRTT